MGVFELEISDDQMRDNRGRYFKYFNGNLSAGNRKFKNVNAIPGDQLICTSTVFGLPNCNLPELAHIYVSSIVEPRAKLHRDTGLTTSNRDRHS